LLNDELKVKLYWLWINGISLIGSIDEGSLKGTFFCLAYGHYFDMTPKS
jgi:hypothetical protein